jgi:hypothetical protein
LTQDISWVAGREGKKKEPKQSYFDQKNSKKVSGIFTCVLSWVDRVEGQPEFLTRLGWINPFSIFY